MVALDLDWPFEKPASCLVSQIALVRIVANRRHGEFFVVDHHWRVLARRQVVLTLVLLPLSGFLFFVPFLRLDNVVQHSQIVALIRVNEILTLFGAPVQVVICKRPSDAGPLSPQSYGTVARVSAIDLVFRLERI